MISMATGLTGESRKDMQRLGYGGGPQLTNTCTLPIVICRTYVHVCVCVPARFSSCRKLWTGFRGMFGY